MYWFRVPDGIIHQVHFSPFIGLVSDCGYNIQVTLPPDTTALTLARCLFFYEFPVRKGFRAGLVSAAFPRNSSELTMFVHTVLALSRFAGQNNPFNPEDFLEMRIVWFSTC